MLCLLGVQLREKLMLEANHRSGQGSTGAVE